jgi:hypothetical protein
MGPQCEFQECPLIAVTAAGVICLVVDVSANMDMEGNRAKRQLCAHQRQKKQTKQIGISFGIVLGGLFVLQVRHSMHFIAAPAKHFRA